MVSFTDSDRSKFGNNRNAANVIELLWGRVIVLLCLLFEKWTNPYMALFISATHTHTHARTHAHTHTHTHTHTHHLSTASIQFYHGGRATPNCVLALLRCSSLEISLSDPQSVLALFTLSSHQLVQHNRLKSPSPLCGIDGIKQLLLIRKLLLIGKKGDRQRDKLLAEVFDLTVS